MTTTRRKFFWGAAALPLAVAPIQSEAATPAPAPAPRMFYVCHFNWALQEFEIVGAFSKRDEAEACVAAIPEYYGYQNTRTIHQWAWREVIDMMVTARLGPIADALRRREVDYLGF